MTTTTTPRHSPTVVARPGSRGRSGIPGGRRMAFILASIFLIVTLLLAVKPDPAGRAASTAAQETTGQNAASSQPAAVNAGGGAISPHFAAPVQHWAPQIESWAGDYGLDPNLVATIMQVESCGDPRAVSSAGARGLFQVMPFHFRPGEDSMDPDTNARRGLTYFVERLNQTGGDVGRAFAGYNGGQRAAAGGWERWPAETQRYFVWTTGIYGEVQEDGEDSPTLQRWLQSGGAGLCRQAARRLGLGR